MTKVEAAAKIAELEARIEALEMVLVQAKSTWRSMSNVINGGRSDAVFSMILEGRER